MTVRKRNLFGHFSVSDALTGNLGFLGCCFRFALIAKLLRYLKFPWDIALQIPIDE